MTPELDPTPGKPSLMTPEEFISELREVETRMRRLKKMREKRYNAVISWCKATRERNKIKLEEMGRNIRIPYSRMLDVFYMGNASLSPDELKDLVTFLRRKISRKQLAMQPSED